MVTLPVFFTSLVTTSAKLVNTLAQSDFFSSVAVAKASAKPVFVKLLTAFIDFRSSEARTPTTSPRGKRRQYAPRSPPSEPARQAAYG